MAGLEVEDEYNSRKTTETSHTQHLGLTTEVAADRYNNLPNKIYQDQLSPS